MGDDFVESSFEKSTYQSLSFCPSVYFTNTVNPYFPDSPVESLTFLRFMQLN